MNVKSQRNSTDARMEERLRTLEAALNTAIERAKAAKAFAQQAKDDAKLAKKDMKRARNALIQAQEEYGLSTVSEAEAGASRPKPVGERIAESPERRRRPRVRKQAGKPKNPDAQVELEQGEADAYDAPAK